MTDTNLICGHTYLITDNTKKLNEIYIFVHYIKKL